MNKSFFFLGLILFVTILPLQVAAQQSVSDFLLTAFEDLNLKSYDSQLDFIRPSNYRVPVIDEFELRWGNDEFNNEDIQYAARFSLSNPWNMRKNKAFFNATSDEIRARKKVEFNENMYDRYETAIDYFYQKELSDLLNKRLSIISKISDTYENNRESDFFDASDFVESKLTQLDNLSDLEESLVETSAAHQKIIARLGTPQIYWDDFQLVSVSAIDSISTLLFSRTVNSVEIELLSERLKVAASEAARERSDINFGFVQFEYFPFTDRDSEYGISAGITLPIFRNKPQIAERKLDEIELENELIAEQFNDSLSNTLEYVLLKNLIGNHRNIQQKAEELNLERALEMVSRIEDYDPIVILELEEGILELEEVLLKSKHRVIEQYLEFLFAYDALIQQPLTNYLSNDFELIE